MNPYKEAIIKMIADAPPFADLTCDVKWFGRWAVTQVLGKQDFKLAVFNALEELGAVGTVIPHPCAPDGYGHMNDFEYSRMLEETKKEILEVIVKHLEMDYSTTFPTKIEK